MPLLREEELQKAISKIRSQRTLPDPPPRPKLPNFLTNESVAIDEKILAIQVFITHFEYNYGGVPFLSLKQNPSLSYIYLKARELIRLSLPIQCVEATFLGCLLTTRIAIKNIPLTRLALSFKSASSVRIKFIYIYMCVFCHSCIFVLQGHVFRHMVLAVSDGKKWYEI